MAKITLKPTENQNFILLGGEFVKVLDLAYRQEAEGDFEGACNTRYKAFQQIVEVLPEEEVAELDFSHQNTCAAIEVVYGSAVDNFLAGDVELAAAQLELLLECDSEDQHHSWRCVTSPWRSGNVWRILYPIWVIRAHLSHLSRHWRSLFARARFQAKRQHLCAVIVIYARSCEPQNTLPTKHI